MHALSRFRHSWARGAIAEVYSAVVLVAVTLATSYAVYSLATFPVSPVSVFSASSFSIYGSPSFLHLQVSSSSSTSVAEFRLDHASSLSGILELTAAGYSTSGSLCAPGSTTFFSVQTGPGILTISGSGTSWIDGATASSAFVQAGWHEVVISNGSGCGVTLPGGREVSGPSSALSSVPMESSVPRSFLFLVPFYASGHVATIVFDGGIELVDF